MRLAPSKTRRMQTIVSADESYVVTIAFFPELYENGLSIQHYDRDSLKIRWVPIEVTLGELAEICEIFQNHFDYTYDEAHLVMRS